MRILANENVPLMLIRELRKSGHDTAWVSERSPGISDTEVVELAVREDRILLTFDLDFAQLAFSVGLKPTQGVILVRIRPLSPAYLTKKTMAALNSRADWAGSFSVLEDAAIRMRKLPP